MKPRHIAIAVVWIFYFASAFSAGIAIGHTTRPPGTVAPFPPLEFAFIALPLFFAFSAGVFFLRRRIYHGWLQNLIDWKWGAGTYREFLIRFKSTLLAILTCLIVGTVGLASAYANERDWTAYFNSAFVLACGLGLLVAYVLSHKFPPKLP